jgi:hypothetical protein
MILDTFCDIAPVVTRCERDIELCHQETDYSAKLEQSKLFTNATLLSCEKALVSAGAKATDLAGPIAEFR